MRRVGSEKNSKSNLTIKVGSKFKKARRIKMTKQSKQSSTETELLELIEHMNLFL
jgi:hypothetical protein